MGSGKTATALHAIVQIPGIRTLVVAPLRVCREVWAQEAAKWPATSHLTFSMILGSAKQRSAARSVAADVYVTNWENLHELADDQFDWLILDESGKLRNAVKWTKGGRIPDPITLQFKPKRLTAYGAARMLSAKAKRVTLMTGTPTPKGIHGLYGQMACIDASQSLGRSKSAFERKWFHQAHYCKHVLIPNAGAEEEITSLTKHLVIAGSDVQLPPQTVNDVWIDLPPKARRAYDDMKSDLFSLGVTAANAAVALGKLIQITSGNIYDNDERVIHIHDAKLDALEEIIEDRNTLCWYGYKHSEAAIIKRFGATTIASKNAVVDWNAGRVPLLLSHPASGGHGLNLQFGGHTMAWFGLMNDLDLYQQACARLARPGQQWPVMIHRILARNTVDARVACALERKDGTQVDILSLLHDELS